MNNPQNKEFSAWLKEMKSHFAAKSGGLLDFDDMPDLTLTHDMFRDGVSPKAAAAQCWDDQLADDPLLREVF